tara:strand:+ start:60 stop:566 length:507 start_codon:yes stop_codon:yes gene_type:complete
LAGLSAAFYSGSCSGHGRCIPANVHAKMPCAGTCETAPKKSIAAMDATNIWPPAPQTPFTGVPTVANVIINTTKFPIVDQDLLTNHPPSCTNLIVLGGCKNPPAPIPCPTQTLCVEDIAGGGGHVRKATATTKSVFFNGRRACRVGDPLGPPCLSLIATGSENVFIGV